MPWCQSLFLNVWYLSINHLLKIINLFHAKVKQKNLRVEVSDIALQ